MEEHKNRSDEETRSNYKKRQNILVISLAILAGFSLCVLGYMLGNNLSFKDLLVEIEKRTISLHKDQTNVEKVFTSTTTSSSNQATEGRIGLPSDSGYTIQYQSIYYQGQPVEDLDFETATYIGNGYIKDNKRVFRNGKLLFGADPEGCTKETIDQCAESLLWKSLYTPYALDVAWNKEPVSAKEIIPDGSCSNEGYVVGVVKNGMLAGGEVLVQNGAVCDMWCSLSTPPVTTSHFVRFNDYLIPINEETGFMFSDSKVRFGESSGGDLSEVSNHEPVIDIPNSDYWLVNANTIGFGSDSEDEEVKYLFTDPLVGEIYRSNYDCFISERPDHVKISYDLGFEYINRSTGVLDINMLDGTKNTEAYQFIPTYHSCYNLVKKDWLKPNERLIKAGEFPNGDEVYRLSNTQDKQLITTYEDKNTLASFEGGKNKYSYNEYLSFNPYLYWQDPFGDWVQFMNRRFETAAEKCKPVVYLYPEKTGDFSVYVEPNGGFTKTIPEYGTGWHVTATPNSQITDKKSGETYPYLYWSGINTGIPQITEGWIVENENTETFLVEKLTQLGLNEQEINDFNEYWIPRFETEGVDQYKIMFLPQHQFEVLAPLTIVGDETPESIIRVMMYAQPAQNGVVLPEQILPATPTRNGFTVVEWGGAMFN
jgi:hypothetical protein